MGIDDMSNYLTLDYTLFFAPCKCYNLLKKGGARMSDLPRVELFTDGACSGNPGPGGYGAILRYGTVEKSCPAANRRPRTTAWN